MMRATGYELMALVVERCTEAPIESPVKEGANRTVIISRTECSVTVVMLSLS
jgi:hypothetical protein